MIMSAPWAGRAFHTINHRGGKPWTRVGELSVVFPDEQTNRYMSPDYSKRRRGRILPPIEQKQERTMAV